MKIKSSGSNTLVYNVYRPPYSQNHRITKKTFLREFNSFIEKINNLNGHVLLTGDFNNLHLEDLEDSYVDSFNQCLQEHGLYQHISEPTHKENGIIDLLISQDQTSIEDITVRADDGFNSDHFPIIFNYNVHLNKHHGKKATNTFWKYKDINNESYKDDLQESHIWITGCLGIIPTVNFFVILGHFCNIGTFFQNLMEPRPSPQGS